MAGGPIPWSSLYVGSSGNVNWGLYSGAGGNTAAHEYGLNVAASLAADATAEIYYQLPEILPSGTANLLLRCRASATSGVAKFNASSGIAANAADPSAATLTAETQGSLTWAAGDTDKFKDLLIPLTALPLVLAARSKVLIALTFTHTSWTLATTLHCEPLLITV